MNATGRTSEGGVFDKGWRSCYVVAISDRRADEGLLAVYVRGRESAYDTSVRR